MSDFLSGILVPVLKTHFAAAVTFVGIFFFF